MFLGGEHRLSVLPSIRVKEMSGIIPPYDIAAKFLVENNKKNILYNLKPQENEQIPNTSHDSCQGLEP